METINNFAIKLNSPQIISFGAIHPQYLNFTREMDRLKTAGIKGVKFHPEYQDFFPDDPALFPLYEQLVALDLVAFFHAGRDIAFSGVHGTPAHFARLIKSFPKLKLVLAHMGGFQMWDEVKEELLGRNVYIDTSFSMDYMGKRTFNYFLEHHDCQRVLFGTDSPWTDQSAELNQLRGIVKDEDTLSKITFTNAKELLGMKP